MKTMEMGIGMSKGKSTAYPTPVMRIRRINADDEVDVYAVDGVQYKTKDGWQDSTGETFYCVEAGNRYGDNPIQATEGLQIEVVFNIDTGYPVFRGNGTGYYDIAETANWDDVVEFGFRGNVGGTLHGVLGQGSNTDRFLVSADNFIAAKPGTTTSILFGSIISGWHDYRFVIDGAQGVGQAYRDNTQIGNDIVLDFNSGSWVWNRLFSYYNNSIKYDYTNIWLTINGVPKIAIGSLLEDYVIDTFGEGLYV
jgi:hypothetical protein